MRRQILTLVIAAWLISVIGLGMQYVPLYVTIITSIALLVTGYDSLQIKHTLLRNYPLIGRLRWVFEHERTKIQQYFIEHDTNGTPYNREKRSDVYQKSKNETNTVPFGTQLNVYQSGYEYIRHSMYPKNPKDLKTPTIIIGSKFCKFPFLTSIYNISAMSYGALSGAAIEALNVGAKYGDFYHNTGEGGISKHHRKGGELCFQIGTGYFGAGKTVDGVRYFDERAFGKNAAHARMIEVKLSQGAKPGHGGILPAKKNTKEIAEIRGVEPHTEVLSPPYHTAFSNPTEMLEFISRLRQISNGKPVGIKMCVGDYEEVEDLIKTMKKKKMYPDFITIDGGEGGTGAAPLVFTNNLGTPLYEGLHLVHSLLQKYGLRKDITLIASGKVTGSFDIIKLLAHGADAVNAARAFMLSMGCIQARECNTNTCPVGIATQNAALTSGLDPAVKSTRVYNYHKNVMHEIVEVIAAMGLESVKELKPEHIIRRS